MHNEACFFSHHMFSIMCTSALCRMILIPLSNNISRSVYSFQLAKTPSTSSSTSNNEALASTSKPSAELDQSVPGDAVPAASDVTAVSNSDEPLPQAAPATDNVDAGSGEDVTDTPVADRITTRKRSRESELNDDDESAPVASSASPDDATTCRTDTVSSNVSAPPTKSKPHRTSTSSLLSQGKPTSGKGS